MRYISAAKSARGFTIVELLVVIVVIGILAAITVISYAGIANRATVASLQSDLENSSKLLKMDQVNNGVFPTTLAAANGGKGIAASSGTTLDYAVDNINNPSNFCITATKNNVSYKITNNSTPAQGDCLDFGLLIRLDAGDSSSYPGSGTTWSDLSGNNYNGTLLNGVAFDSGQGTGAMSFDGINDNVDMGSGFTWNGPLTVITWHKRTVKDTVNADGIFGNWYWNSTAANRRGWGQRYYINTDSLEFTVEATDGSNIQEVQTSYASTSVNNWYHSVGVFDPINRATRLYVNGTQRSSNTLTVGYNNIAYNSPYPLRVGYNPVNGGYFTGYVAEVRVYNRVLSTNEISSHFNGTKAKFGL